MKINKGNIFKNIDWLTVLLYAIMVAFGWMNIYAASIGDNDFSVLSLQSSQGKQMLWIGFSIVLIIFIFILNSKFYEDFSVIFYMISILSLVSLFIFGKEINGARSWFSLGSSTLQPSEFAKFATALALAKLMSDKLYDLSVFKNIVKTFALISIPVLLITLQPDPGSALVYLSLVFVLYREGLSVTYLFIGFLAIVLFILTLLLGSTYVTLISYTIMTLWFLYIRYYKGKSLKFEWLKISSTYVIVILYIFSTSYIYNNVFKQRHRDRFSLILGMKEDNMGIGYNTNQSILTIRSGGLSGKGFLKGDRTQGNFVPEQGTDYIFSTIGEEWGFIGTSLVVICYMIFILRIVYLAEDQKSKFSRIYGYSVASIFFFHFTINIGMVIGLMPTIGIPLPFFSYGGSSLWGFTILLFIFLKLDANKKNEW
ncbi:MAG: rod shape-determining protein RodA [Flavobacteriaceae bacterium]|nr:rod shape-determining protein RodA [Flavobacteriaceae bacterium]